MMTYNLKRSARKTMGIHILLDGSIEVRAPYGVPESEIENLLQRKMDWIHQKQQELCAYDQARNAFKLENGSQLNFLGKAYPLVCQNTSKIGFNGENFFFPDFLSTEDLKRNVVGLYKQMAKDVLNSKVKDYAKIMKASPRAVKINSAKTRWGSCSGKNNLNFSWKLIMAPEEAVDYVVIHELAHTFEHNHSRNFWEIVAYYMPEYAENQALLKAFEKTLSQENWDL